VGKDFLSKCTLKQGHPNDKVAFKLKLVRRDKPYQFILIKGTIYQVEIILNDLNEKSNYSYVHMT
jgi:hypothetical protein